MSSRTAAGRGAKLKHHTRKVRAKKLQERPLLSVNDPYFYNRNYFYILFPLLRLELVILPLIIPHLLLYMILSWFILQGELSILHFCRMPGLLHWNNLLIDYFQVIVRSALLLLSQIRRLLWTRMIIRLLQLRMMEANRLRRVHLLLLLPLRSDTKVVHFAFWTLRRLPFLSSHPMKKLLV
jgi:hypothetical protein